MTSLEIGDPEPVPARASLITKKRPPKFSAGNGAAKDGGDVLHGSALKHHLASAKRACITCDMSRELVNEICAAQPGAEWSDPWGCGHDCWKIGGKSFAVIGTVGTHVSVKTDGVESAVFLIETGVAERAAYLHESWVALPLDAAPDELAHRIRQSYRIVRAGLPKKRHASLPPL